MNECVLFGTARGSRTQCDPNLATNAVLGNAKHGPFVHLDDHSLQTRPEAEGQTKTIKLQAQVQSVCS
jgi:hypothetical protein